MPEKAKKGAAKPVGKGVGKAPEAKKGSAGIKGVEDRAAPATRTNIACE